MKRVAVVFMKLVFDEGLQIGCNVPLSPKDFHEFPNSKYMADIRIIMLSIQNFIN